LNILIITDGNTNIGFGHIIRCKEIEYELRKTSHNLSFVILSESKLSFDQIITTHRPHLVILDLSSDMTDIINQLNNYGSKVVTIEYYQNKVLPDLNFSVNPFPHPIKSGLHLFGPQYIIIRREIRNNQRKIQSRDYGVIMLGGNLKEKELINIINRIKTPNLKHYIINKSPMLINKKFRNTKVEILNDPKNLNNIMIDCGWCITNGGITMLEMIYYSKQIYCYPNNKNELILAKKMIEKKLIKSINSKSISIDSNYKSMENKIFDGLGAKRIVKVIDQL